MILPIGKRPQIKSRAFTPLQIKDYLSRERFVTGFTFIELILVAALILVLVGISVPLFRRSFSGIQAKDASQNVVQLMRYAQAKAIAERKLCRVNFDFIERAFWLSVQDETSPQEFKRLKGKWGLTFKAPEGISIEGEASFVAFYPDGTSDKAKIKISDNKAATFTIITRRTIKYVQAEE